jgi:DNA polymerase/3'-5' exonuclease PolX
MELQKAKRIADRVVEVLKRYCHNGKCQVAGSVRRECPDVGDIEVVVLPLEVPAQASLFGQVSSWKRMPEFVELLKSLGGVIKGSPETGRYVQIAISSKAGEFLINLDVFMPQADDYFRQLAIRTGSANYSALIARTWKAAGYCGTEDGLRRISQCVKEGKVWKCTEPNPMTPPVWTSEYEFFTWLQMPYLDPHKRK